VGLLGEYSIDTEEGVRGWRIWAVLGDQSLEKDLTGKLIFL